MTEINSNNLQGLTTEAKTVTNQVKGTDGSHLIEASFAAAGSDQAERGLESGLGTAVKDEELLSQEAVVTDVHVTKYASDEGTKTQEDDQQV